MKFLKNLILFSEYKDDILVNTDMFKCSDYWVNYSSDAGKPRYGINITKYLTAGRSYKFDYEYSSFPHYFYFREVSEDGKSETTYITTEHTQYTDLIIRAEEGMEYFLCKASVSASKRDLESWLDKFTFVSLREI